MAPVPSPHAFFEQLGENLGRRLAARFPQKTTEPLTPPRSRPAAPVARAKPTRVSVARAAAKPARAARPTVRKGKAGAFAAGDLVSYRQGRGTFSAEVVRVDAISGIATLQRTNDGKRVIRPLDRVYAA